MERLCLACATVAALLVLAGIMYGSGQFGQQWLESCPEDVPPPWSEACPVYVPTDVPSCCPKQDEHEALLAEELYHQRTFPMRLKRGPHEFWRYWFRATWRCASLELVGYSWTGDGPKWTCTEIIDAAHSANNCLIYSAGIDGDVSFEVGIKQRWPNCQVHSFEMLPISEANPEIIKALDQHNITYHYSFPFKNLEEHMRQLGHADRNLTVFKCDIEGGEYNVLANMFKPSQRTWRWSDRIGQVLMEVHIDPAYVGNQRAAAYESASYIDLMEAEGFRIFSSEINREVVAEVSWLSNQRADLLLKSAAVTYTTSRGKVQQGRPQALLT